MGVTQGGKEKMDGGPQDGKREIDADETKNGKKKIDGGRRMGRRR
jgi:hypothetical protein